MLFSAIILRMMYQSSPMKGIHVMRMSACCHTFKNKIMCHSMCGVN